MHSCIVNTTTSTTLRIRRSDERGHFTHGWLDTRHTFSFGDYYDPAHMGFRSLRVINDDVIAPGSGFPTHPHRDMEIFSYVLEGTLAHQDSMGNRRELKPGEIQLMRAGSGVTHSEFNPSASEPVHILQIWIQPEKRGLPPAYTEWVPSANHGSPKTLVISHDGRDGSAQIAQDAEIYRILTHQANTTVTHFLRPDRGIWLHVIRGEARIGDVRLAPGDAVSLEESMTLEFTSGSEPLEALLFDLH
jgi:redox-sensitive bicupin YhaK (pirin superfamily)